MLLTETGLIFRGVRPLLRLGAVTKSLSMDELLPINGGRAQLRMIPPDAWPGDAQHGRDMVAGLFRFAGHTIEKENLSWQPEGAPPEWLDALHSFEWLRNLRSVGGDRARRMAREMVSLWIEQYQKPHPLAWRADIMGARLASWIAFHDFFCASADEEFRKNYFTSLMRQARALARALPGELEGMPLLRALRGLAYTGLSLEDGAERLEQAFDLLLTQIGEQILADGTHISRSPRHTFEFLQCLVDLRTALIAAKMEMPEELQHAIDRITPAVKFFRHGDGGLAQFNGGQEGNAHLCEATLMHSGARGKAMKSLPQAGYERLNLGRASLIMDTGVTLSSQFSDRAHAGLLSFEYSYGRERIFVNCGTSEKAGKWQRVLRSTLAHTTLSVDNRNACTFDGESLFGHRPTVRARRHENDDMVILETSHNGYTPRFNLTHARLVRLTEQGEVLSGEDQLTGRVGVPFAARFHLHPDIQASCEEGDIILRSKSGVFWRFQANAAMAIEESVYVSEDEKPVPSLQIVLSGMTGSSTTIISWEMRRQF